MNNNLKNKYFIHYYEDGYEDPKETIKQKAQKLIEDSKKPKELVTTKNIIILIIWSLIFNLFKKYGFGMIYICITIIFLIFYNLGERKPWELSAYSVFNQNNQQIIGDINLNNVMNLIGNNNEIINEQIERERRLNEEIEKELHKKIEYNTKSENKKRELKEKAVQKLNSKCLCGSGKKYKNCCLKKNS